MIRSIVTAVSLSLCAGAAFAATDVPVGPFHELQLRGGGHVIVHQGAVQRVLLLKGSTQFTRVKLEGDKLVIDACNDQCPNLYDLEIEITAPTLTAFSLEGGGHIEAKGDFAQADKLSVAVHGGGRLDLRAIPAAAVNAAVMGGGDILVKAERTLNAAVMGGGVIHYSGEPQIHHSVMGGGSVVHE